MKMLTPKEIIKKSDAALLEQGSLGKGENGCFYYSCTTQNRCGVGVLLSPEDAEKLQSLYSGPIYTILQSSYGYKAIEMFKSVGIDLNDSDVINTLDDIQVRHDQSDNFDDWKRNSNV